MKGLNLIGWLLFLGVLSYLTVDFAELLKRTDAVPYIVGGFLVFWAAFNVLGVKLEKKKRTSKGRVKPKRKKPQGQNVGDYRTNGSYIPEQYRNQN